MDCTRARSLLHPWLDGELERDDHKHVVEHLTRCEQCDARFRDEQRLLARVRTGLAAPCPDALRARLVACLAAAAPVARPRAAIVSFRRAAAAAACLAVAFVWTDPICLRGCPTVRALAREHLAAPASINSSTAGVKDVMGAPVLECDCMGLECQGWERVACCKTGCLIRYKDGRGKAISFVKLKDGHVHRWLAIRAGGGLILARQDGCRFAGWKDRDGGLCGFVCDESMDQAELVALSERARGHE